MRFSGVTKFKIKSLTLAGLPPRNDKIRGTLSNAENCSSKKKEKKGKFFQPKKKMKSAEFPWKSGSPALVK